MADYFPKLPAFYNMPWARTDGRMHTEAQLYNDQMFQTMDQLVGYMNVNLTPAGYYVPQATTAIITGYRDDNNVPVGAIWFNTNLSKLQVKTALGSPGTIETITSV